MTLNGQTLRNILLPILNDKLRDEADIIITNPPFSLFREFLSWIMEANKQFVIIGNQNVITYKEVFPYLKANKIWLGYSIHSGDRKFNVPDDYPLEAAGCGIDNDGKKFIRVKGVRWFTNLDHGIRHENLMLDTMAHNLKFPSDYDGIMGVPITFMDKYNPDQFEIIDGIGRYSVMNNEKTKKDGKYLSMINGKAKFFRIIIKKK